MKFVKLRFVAVLTFLVAPLAKLPPTAGAETADEGLQAVVVTAHDERIGGRIMGLADGQLQIATDPPRSIALADIARIDVGAEVAREPTGGDLEWIGQDNHDLVQVGGASGGNGIQDLHLRAKNLRAVGIKQITVVCRFPKQLRVWRFDTSQSPHWRLAIARADLAPEAELYLEPAAIDSFNQEFQVTFTYNDGAKTKASVVATTHTSDGRKINRRARAGSKEPPPDDEGDEQRGSAQVYLTDSGQLRGDITAMDAESLTLRTRWEAEFTIPLLRVRGIWLGSVESVGTLPAFEETLSAPEDQDVVFVAAADGATDSAQLSVQGMKGEKLVVSFEEKERGIKLERLRGIVFAAHTPEQGLTGPHQAFVLANGDQFTGRWVGLEGGKLQIETAWQARFDAPAEEVAEIRVLGGKLTWLPDVEPVAVEQVPYFGRLIGWQRDAGFDGKPPKLRGKSPARVLAMHSRCVLTYALDGEYKLFKSTLGFDDTAGSLGCVDCRVLVDGREVFAREGFRTDHDPVAVDVELAGAQQLSLEVDFGAGEDVGDRILWAEPRLFRAEEE